MSFDSLGALIRTHGVDRADEPAVIAGDERVSFGELFTRSRRVATGLVAAGVGPGDRVAIIDKNGVAFFELAFGAALVNAAVVSINWRLAPAESAYIVNDAAASVVLVGADLQDRLDALTALLDRDPLVLVVGARPGSPAAGVRSYEDWVASHDDDDPAVPAAGDDIALQLYTSGTTGHPKGAQITNDNLRFLCDATEPWGFRGTSVSLAAMPLFHIGGAGWSLVCLAAGSRVVLMRELDPAGIGPLVAREGVTHAFLVPAVLQFMLDVPGGDFSSMEFLSYGASPITQDVLERSMAQWGCGFYQLYGLTETSGAVTVLDAEDHHGELLRSAGKPMRDVELRIVDPVTDESLPDGEVGELWIRSPTNMAGYWNLPEATAAAMPGDGWFRSGDAGYLRDGYLYIHDRVKDMIVSGAENIYPAEIENALMAHPDIVDCAVIGVPDDKWGETPKAIVVPAPGAALEQASVIAHCRRLIASFKCPTSVDLVEAIPRNPSGKVLKRELRAPYWAERDRLV